MTGGSVGNTAGQEVNKMFVLFIVMYLVSVNSDMVIPTAVTINSTQFDDSAACASALYSFHANIPNSPLNPTFAWCVPASSKQATGCPPNSYLCLPTPPPVAPTVPAEQPRLSTDK